LLLISRRGIKCTSRLKRRYQLNGSYRSRRVPKEGLRSEVGVALGVGAVDREDEGHPEVEAALVVVVVGSKLVAAEVVEVALGAEDSEEVEEAFHGVVAAAVEDVDEGSKKGLNDFAVILLYILSQSVFLHCQPQGPMDTDQISGQVQIETVRSESIELLVY